MKWFAPIIAFLLFIPFSAKIDLATSQFFFTEDHFVDNSFTKLCYSYGEYPGFVAGALALLIFLFSKKNRKKAFVVGFALFLGSGLLVNGILKEHIQRARPKQILEFGGRYPFRPLYDMKVIKVQEPDGQKSFPSGHATMGFYFFALGFAMKRYRAYGFILALLLGTLLSLVRIAQGGHFVSDTIAAGIIMWYAALFALYLTSDRVWTLPQRVFRKYQQFFSQKETP